MDISLSLLLPSFLFPPFLSSSPFPPSLLYFSPALGMYICMYICISSVQSLSRVQLFATSWTAARQASLSFTIPWILLKLMSIESVMPSNHLSLCRPLLLLPSVFPSIRVFSSEYQVAKVLELQLQHHSFQ